MGGGQVVRPGRSFPNGFPVAAADPIAIEGLPDGTVLILDSPAGVTVRANDDGAYRDFGLGGGLFGFGQGLAHERRRGW